MFTSGTAGFPRAAKLTHGNLLANIEQMQANPHRQQGSDDVTFGVLPFFHIFGLNVVLDMALRTGGARAGRRAVRPRVRPRVGRRSTRSPSSPAPRPCGRRGRRWPVPTPTPSRTVRIAGSGAAKLDPAVRSMVQERFGLRIDEGYGLTEASPVVTTATGIPAPPGSIGAPLPGVRVRLIDADEQDVLVGDVGEIRVQGPNVFHGLLGRRPRPPPRRSRPTAG